MANTATRLITLIMLLERQPNQKARELARALGVSVRTLHRYFTMLDEMGIPLYSERGPYGGFSLVRGYRMPPLVLTPEEAVAVSLGVGLVEDFMHLLSPALYAEFGLPYVSRIAREFGSEPFERPPQGEFEKREEW